MPRLRLRVRFSLRGLLALMLICGVGFGTLGAKVYTARKQDAAVTKIHELGGYAFYDYQTTQLQGKSALRRDNFGPAAVSPISPWLLKLFGDGFLVDVVAVDLSGHAIGAKIGILLPAPRGQVVRFSSRPVRNSVRDDHLQCLVDLRQLRELDLTFQDVTDNGLAYLTCWHSLERLILQDTKITDAGLVQLHRFTSLKRLHLHNTEVTRAGIEELQRALPDCEVFWEGDLL